MEAPMMMPTMNFNSNITRTIPKGDCNEMPEMSFFDHKKKREQVKANATGKPLKTNKTFKVNMKIGPTMILNFKKE